MSTVKEAKVLKQATPSNEEVVTLLCKKLRKEVRSVTDARGGATLKKHLVIECPNPHCRNEKREITFQEGKGYTNPFNHLKSCLFHGNASKSYNPYKENLDTKNRTFINQTLTYF